jgi:hypothetical protein
MHDEENLESVPLPEEKEAGKAPMDYSRVDGSLVPLGCLVPIVFVLLLGLDVLLSISGLPGASGPSVLFLRIASFVSALLVFPFSLLFPDNTPFPVVIHWLGCAFWTAVVCLLVKWLRKRATKLSISTEEPER